jgi:transposase
MKPKELEVFYQTSFKSICNWVNKLNDGGVDALIDKEKPGRPPKLTNDQKEKIKYLILDQTPESHGYNSSTWTGSLVIDWVTKNYNVVYKKAQIYNILEGLGLTFQKGKGYYPEAKDRTEKVEALKKTRARKE